MSRKHTVCESRLFSLQLPREASILRYRDYDIESSLENKRYAGTTLGFHTATVSNTGIRTLQRDASVYALS